MWGVFIEFGFENLQNLQILNNLDLFIIINKNFLFNIIVCYIIKNKK